MKTCRMCGNEYPPDRFQLANTIKGKKYYRLVCTSCKVEQQRQRIQKNKAEVRKLKLVCIQCGEDHPATLAFHHRDDKKKSFNIGDAYDKSLDRLLEEVEKCDVMCHNCHAILHYNNG